MTSPAPPTSLLKRPGPAELFTPKLITVLREGYRLEDLRADVLAGLTVAIVALPLSMAIAIASGVSPERGLFTAAIGGFLISALGGSRFQIGGPAAAFTVLVASTVARHGVDGLFLATIMAGIFLFLMGALRLGSYIKFIPYPVTVGFISGIAVILFAGQVSDLLGLTLAGKEPADLAAFPVRCRHRPCRPFPSPRSAKCSPMRCRSPCWAPSNRCSRRSLPTA